MRPHPSLFTACILACVTAEMVAAAPHAHGDRLQPAPFAQLRQDQQHPWQLPFRIPWPLRNPFSCRPTSNPSSPPPSSPPYHHHAFRLDHVFAHGAPGSKHWHVFRRLKVDTRMRQEMAHARAAFVASELATASRYAAQDSSHRAANDAAPIQPLHLFSSSSYDTLTNNFFEYDVQSTTHQDQESEEDDSMATKSSFPWPWRPVPDVTDQETVRSFARMALDCYVDPARQGWVDIGDQWDVGMDIGWMEAGLRGYVFASDDGKTVIVGIKGTSLKLFGTGGGPTGNNDKLNDNKMFSCCCGKVDRTWWGVCSCYMGGNQCNQQCLVSDLTKDRDESESYVGIGLRVIEAVKALYPDKTIWLTGHSLGGSVASMLGVTHGYPVIAFQAPGDRLYAERTQLVKQGLTPSQIAKYPVWHIGPTADPIYMGTCNGPTSTCYTAGYAMESRCHLGKVCRYNTTGELGWHQGIQHHTIVAFIDVIDKWQNLTKGRETVPSCEPQGECQDCTQWEYM